MNRTSTPTVSWPSSSGNPINEFTTEGYISCAFPTLFPTGAADFVAPRQRCVTVGNYFKHMMLYHDMRFAKHPRFRYIFYFIYSVLQLCTCFYITKLIIITLFLSIDILLSILS